MTAAVFTIVNAGLLRVRISAENAAIAQALAQALPPPPAMTR
jgi:isoprenylcysteine carboxyl methyltransferase (ICMT) family protein YpbQ